MNNLNAKQFLRSYQRAKTKLQLIENQIEEIKNILGISGISYDAVKIKSSPAEETTSGKIIILAEIKQQAEEIRTTAIEMVETVNKVIEQVGDDRYRILLSLRYIKCLGWEQIADEMGYGVRHIHKLHSGALLEVESIISKIIEK